jgi:hypothetical protein
MTIALRHSCRHCRTKLDEPTENLRRAFCARGCYRSFYRSRCRVCEAPIRRKNEQQKVCYGKECKAELRRFPERIPGPKVVAATHLRRMRDGAQKPLQHGPQNRPQSRPISAFGSGLGRPTSRGS